MKPTEKEICWMLTELREILDECGIPTLRADKIGDYTTGIIVPSAYIADVREILEEGEHPATVEDHKVCGIVKAVYQGEKIMKTIRQWFEDELPADIAAMAIKNAEVAKLDGLKVRCLQYAIKGGFIWYTTPQGNFFWEQVCAGNYGQIEYSKEDNK